MTVTHHYPTRLSLHDLTLSVHLGYGAQERKAPQPIILTIDFYFAAMPQSAIHDGKGFLCYDALTQHLKGALAGKEFQLIEYVTPYLGEQIQTWLESHKGDTGVETIHFTLSLLKSEAPVEELRGGASYTYTTLPQGLLG